MLLVSFLHWVQPLSIWQVGDCGLQTYQTATKFERATTDRREPACSRQAQRS